MSLPREPWQDWTKEQWICSLPASEQVRIRAMSEDESMRAFLDWRGKMTNDLCERRDRARARGELPPSEDKPQYGNAPTSGVIIAGTTVGGPNPYGYGYLRPMGAGFGGGPGHGPGGFGGHGFGGPGHGPGGPGGPR